ncbi:hypothetical protein [Tropicimonas isoalkanivorans]|uniref:Lipoprotein n=1 Tax=Tropicimonas isoalkanivorans TaxID=441112 RepID=A0A1I1D5U2_9RHOB|nr:hypothetical protein [Tropicimonas isoalkanivorans]SFB70291.1 hypothetical protein SAMN04488094_10113 [Tropicimonas isoalkanivorans]
MKVQIVAGLAAALVLTGCQSRYNPVNWSWGGGNASRTTLAPDDGYEDKTERRPLVSQVLSMDVERVPGGAIVTAVGLPPTQGYWKADLVSTYQTVTGEVAAKDGEIRLEFKIIPPPVPNPVVNQQSREVVAGTYLTDQTLYNVRRITVVAANNSVASSR